MEIFGSTFDDSVFCKTKDKVSVELVSSYNAKVCEAQWFCDSAALDTEDTLEKQKVFKFRGDLASRQGNYQKALDAYNSCLEWIPDNNMTIRRDVLEGIARCYYNLGQRERALEVADLLSKEASNTCHLVSLLLLKVNIHQYFGTLGSKMASLEQLCSLLPFNPWNWYDLGQTCLQQLETNTPPGFCSAQNRDAYAGSKDGLTEEEREVERADEEEEDGVLLKACMCFIRTRLLLRLLHQQQSSFVLRRSESALRRANEALEWLNPGGDTLQDLTEVMTEDLVPEKMREDNQDGESLASVGLQSFAERWWNKVLSKAQEAGRPEPQKPSTEPQKASIAAEGFN